MKLPRAGVSIIALLVLSGACSAPDEAPPLPVDSRTFAGKERQGPVESGTRVGDHWIPFTIGARALSVTRANIVLTLRSSGTLWGTQLTNWTLTGNDGFGGGISFYIRGVYPHLSGSPAAQQPDEWEYDVTFTAQGERYNLCTEDPAQNRAIPLYYPGMTLFSFICVGSARAKCFDLGYKPWVSGASRAETACVAAMRADYCGNRWPNTVLGTTVDFYDAFTPTINARTPGSTWPLEAAWDEDGYAKCLSKRRWLTLPSGGRCQTQEICESRPISDWVARGARLFTDSSLIDVGLYSWTGQGDGRLLITSAYDQQATGATQISDPTGVFNFRRFEGSLFSPDSDPALRPGTVPIFRSYSVATKNFITSTLQPPSGYIRNLRPEGYLYDRALPQPRGTAALFTWKTSGGNIETSTNPAGRPATAYLEGYVIDEGRVPALRDPRDRDGDGVPGHRSDGTVDTEEDGDDSSYDQRAFCRQATGRISLGDFNGDGRDDLLCHDSASGYLSIDTSAGEGASFSSLTSFCAGSNNRLLVGDFNGDGRDDLLCQGLTSGDHRIWLAAAGGAFSGATALQGLRGCTGNVQILVGDFNGDGRDDLLCDIPATGQKGIAYAESGGVFSALPGYIAQATWCATPGRTLVGDFNGDGRADLLCHRKSDGFVWIAQANTSGRITGTSWQSPLGWCVGASQELYAAQLRGSGRTDLLCHDASTGYKWLSYADSAGSFSGTSWEGNERFCKGGPDNLSTHNAGRLLLGRLNFGPERDLLCHYQQGLGGLRMRLTARNPYIGFQYGDLR